jgi:hypothetical protein
MSSSRRWLLQPRVLALFGLGIFGICVLLSTSKTATETALNLIPVILAIGLEIGIPALIVWWIIVFLSRLTAKPAKSTVEDRLDELERLKRRDMVTPEEYAAKRQDILKDL